MESAVPEVLYRSFVLITNTVSSSAAVKRGVSFLTGLLLSLLRAGWQFE